MCLGIPGQIVEIVDPQTNIATADVAGVKRSVNVGLVAPEGIGPGDWVLIHVGFAMSKIDEAEAKASIEFLGPTRTNSNSSRRATSERAFNLMKSRGR
jgi:hydrogenase expression/formation protein HypC